MNKKKGSNLINKKGITNIGLIIIGIAVILLVFGIVFLFSNGKKSDKGNNEPTIEIKESKFNGVYVKDGSTVKLYSYKESSLFFELESSDNSAIAAADIKGDVATGKIFDDVYTFKLVNNGVEVTVTNNDSLNGTYKKTSDYTSKDYYTDNLGDPTYISTKYNGLFSDGNKKIYMYQNSADTVIINIVYKAADEYIGYNRFLAISADGRLVEDDLSGDNSEIYVEVKDNELVVSFTGEYEKLNGTYKKDKSMNLDELIYNYYEF